MKWTEDLSVGVEKIDSQHKKFLADLDKLKKKLEILEGEKKKGSYDFSVETNQVVVEWIIDHVAEKDKKLGVFLKTRI